MWWGKDISLGCSWLFMNVIIISSLPKVFFCSALGNVSKLSEILGKQLAGQRCQAKGAIKSNLEWMARTTASQNVDRCSAQELDAINDIPEIADLAANGDPRHQKVRKDAIKEFLRLKKQRQIDRQGVNWHFRLPELTLQKCPHLDSFDAASGAKFYNWKDVTLKQLERHHATSAHRLELTKTLLDKKYMFLVSHCQDAEEIFDILEQKIPPKSEICRHLEDRIALGGQALGKEANEMSLHKKAESVQVLLSQLGLVESDFDISKATVDSCLLSFGTGAGSHMEQARLTSAWYEAKRSSNQFMSFSLDVWLETFKSALSGASATRVRAEKLTLVDVAVKAAGSKQGRQSSAQKNAGVSQDPGPSPSAPSTPVPTCAGPPPPPERVGVGVGGCSCTCTCGFQQITLNPSALPFSPPPSPPSAIRPVMAQKEGGDGL